MNVSSGETRVNIESFSVSGRGVWPARCIGADKMRAVYQACRLASADGNFECRPAIASTLGSRWEKLESEFAKFIKRRSESEANRRWGILRSDAYSATDRMLAEKPCN